MTLVLEAITLDCTDPRRVAAFWSAALRYDIAEEQNGWILLRPRVGVGPPLACDQVPEPKVVMHLDLRPAAGSTMEAEVARLEGLGAKAVRQVTNWPDKVHTVMRDPEGNEFCVIRP